MFLSHYTVSIKALSCVVCLSAIGNIAHALNVGVVDEMKVVNSKAYQGLIQPQLDKVSAYKKELKTLATESSDTDTQLKGSTDEKTIEAKKQESNSLQEKSKETSGLLNAALIVLEKQMQDTLQASYVSVAKENNYDILFDRLKGVVYVDPKLEVTDSVIQQLPVNTSAAETIEAVSE